MAGRRAACYGKTLLQLSSGAAARPHSGVPAVAKTMTAATGATRRVVVRVSQQARRELSFSFPGPRKLEDITNLPLLAKEEKESIADIWTAYHDEREDSLGTVIPGDSLDDLQAKAKKCPMFVLPVWRDEGHFMMLSQYQDMCFLLTYLEDYKVNPGGAQPYATISMYNDLVDSKGLGLIRADITPNLTKKEVDRLVRLLIRFYSPHMAHNHVEAFNLRPQEFDLEKLLQETPRD
ncbi:unnamed protein product [Ectocarpus fasciculatus]